MAARHSVVIDFETRSLCDLREVGTFRYASDLRTEVYCVVFAYDNDQPVLWVSDRDPKPPETLI
jgi:hypothetical protein